MKQRRSTPPPPPLRELSKETKNAIQSILTKEIGSNKVKLPKVGSNAIVCAHVGAGPNKLPCLIDGKGVSKGKARILFFSFVMG